MSNEKHETVEDNVSANHQFREVAKMTPHDEVVVSKMETATPTGNAAAMREALMMAKRLFDGRLMWQTDIRKAHEAVNAALAAPPRNCDVGTAEEQEKRFLALCDSNNCSSCPVRFKGKTDCVFTWAQMPYDEVAK